MTTYLTNTETKKGQLDFDMSEPEFLIQYMNRHEDWAVIICLIGGGQEINTGEAGLGEWFETIKYKHKDWNVFVSNRITDDEYRRGKDLNTMLSAINANIKEDLHLSVSLRSFRSENLSGFVKSLLDVECVDAKELFNTLKDNYDIVITRDLVAAKNWIKNKARGTERYGMIASSGALRLKAEGIFVKNDIEAKNWFLNDCLDVRSSYYLEDTATEFDIQGLELDFALVAWGADFRFNGEEFIYKQFRGNKWININSNDKKLYLKNAYRVLLTRARQGMVIYVPYGDDNDHTRRCEYYNGIYEYMKEIGIEGISKY
ncbi:DNA/RNA helicase domain-containing protein [Clostridiisalibacter paucivorans]|uniref:DNA/RNA helicase domain-containing protein n=1 Tax=Clostridiisalibacter paucivorans TaxID=408753 RepID=UPI00068843FA|nr:DNA/RNA helicase domain-containing protein [Clostridiisalibacter paucivorans]